MGVRAVRYGSVTVRLEWLPNHVGITCIRDYIHVDDLAAAHILALGKIGPGSKLAYNVGVGRGYSVREVIRTAEEVTGLKVPVKIGPRRPRARCECRQDSRTNSAGRPSTIT